LYKLSNHKGITLIELMIVVAIIGILAGIAYPSYQDSVRKSRRAEAHTGLFALQLAMEKARGNCSSYATATTTSTSSSCTSASKTVTFTNNSEYYDIGIGAASGIFEGYAVASASDYTLVAVAKGAQASDSDCAKITLTRNGTQGGTSGSACW